MQLGSYILRFFTHRFQAPSPTNTLNSGWQSPKALTIIKLRNRAWHNNFSISCMHQVSKLVPIISPACTKYIATYLPAQVLKSGYHTFTSSIFSGPLNLPSSQSTDSDEKRHTDRFHRKSKQTRLLSHPIHHVAVVHTFHSLELNPSFARNKIISKTKVDCRIFCIKSHTLFLLK